MNEKDHFSQLVDDLVTGRLTLNQVQIAIRAAIRRWEHLPEPIINLLAGSGESDPGLIYRMFEPIKQMIGNTELAYRRGFQAGEELRNMDK